MARGLTAGGIYGRPIVNANLVHFTVMSFALLRVVIDGPAAPGPYISAFVYAAFAVWFGVVMFRAPR